MSARAAALRDALCALAMVSASLLLGACSALVDPDSLVIKCEVTAGLTNVDPCEEEGLHCVGGVCQECEGEREDCNGVDDDCDGVIDEGHDLDSDGFSWCGGGVPELADCVPNDPDIHPGSITAAEEPATVSPPMESCDGKDNDCDGRVDEAESCEVDVGCSETGCPEGLLCDADTDRCIVPRPVGAGCTSDADCAAGFCMDTSAFSSGDVADTRCATACCSDADCADGTVCEATEDGVRACLPMEIAGRGTGAAAGTCSMDSDCASGLCARETCTERCHAEMACGETQSCILASARNGGPLQWLCGDAEGRGDGGELCISFDPTSCKSGACFEGQCAIPCARRADCPSDLACSIQEVALLVPLTRVNVAICSAMSAPDQLCCTNSDCLTGICKPKALAAGYTMTCQAP